MQEIPSARRLSVYSIRDSRRAISSAIAVVTLVVLILIATFCFGSSFIRFTNSFESGVSFLAGGSNAHASTNNTRATSSPSGTKFWYVGAASGGGQNSGVRSLIQVKDQNRTRGVVSFWVSEAFSNGLWAQVGYYIENGSAPVAFYQIWSLTNRSEITTGTTAVGVGFHEFTIVRSRGTVWQFALDSRAFGSFNAGTSRTDPTYPIYAMSEEGYVSEPFSFDQVLFSKAIQIRTSGAWSNVARASSYGSSWGVGGKEQLGTLAQDQLIVGGELPRSTTSVSLWSG